MPTRTEQFLKILAEHDEGISARDIAGKVGLTQSHVAECLRAMRKLKLAGNSSNGSSSVWALEGRWQTLRDEAHAGAVHRVIVKPATKEAKTLPRVSSIFDLGAAL